jgi:uncharacterized membrane protein SpoIIM required for sporulation
MPISPPGARSQHVRESVAADVDRFVARRSEDWKELASLAQRIEVHGARGLSVSEVHAFGRLYRATCADLLVARETLQDARLADYLDALVARSYGLVYAPERPSRWRVLEFVWGEFPRLVRANLQLVALAYALLLAGAGFGAFVITTDPSAVSVVVPDMHLEQTPKERVQQEGLVGEHDAGKSAVFSSYLFTHNIQVTFLVFALGITGGLGTALVLFWNGIPLGALAAQYHASGEGLFFWAWILPHGVVELTVIAIAGAAGFVLARGVLFPATLTRRAALKREARTAVQLILGGMPMLVAAGLVEGTISQMHEPFLPYWVKLAFAGALLLAEFAYLGRGAISDGAPRDSEDG